VAEASGWVPQTLPLARQPNGELRAVSCPSRNACVAVGDYLPSVRDFAQAIAELWDGTAWSVQRVPEPAGTEDAILNGVSCVSSTDCVAVGWYDTGEHDGAFLEVWDGRVWSLRQVPSVVRYLYDVSCASGRACVAVGVHGYGEDDAGNDTSKAVVARWNGARWSVRVLRGLPGSSFVVLGGVSCWAARGCVAVGVSDSPKTKDSGQLEPIATQWHGARWSIQPMPGNEGLNWFDLPPGGADDSPPSVACAAASACVVVSGWQAERWDGVRWIAQRVVRPAHAGGAGLLAVSCASKRSCLADGSVRDQAGVLPLIERWRHGRWSIERSSRPGRARRSGLMSVSCKPSSACVAVGSVETVGSVGVALAERRTQGTWSIQNAPNLTGLFPVGSLQAVSCPSASACVAVAQLDGLTQAGEQATEVWNGLGWTLHVTPNPPGTPGPLTINSLSCGAITACVALGTYGANGRSEEWNGPPGPSRALQAPS
jgi:hypothetical protein